MEDFIFRNDTKLFFRNDIRESVLEIAKGHKVLWPLRLCGFKSRFEYSVKLCKSLIYGAFCLYACHGAILSLVLIKAGLWLDL